ncbi:phage tail protein [Pseudonocardia sp. CA-107938]|uniref:phage tail protein n=1 Tax=Pseudonocardia sp. CA-107938 TaxID=3240021 RepID=UPI003D8D449D
MISSGMAIGLNWVPGVRPLQPFTTFNFAVEVEGLLVGGFSEVNGLEAELETEPYREGGVNGFTHKLPTVANPGTLTLRHGLTALSTLWNWYDDTVRGVIHRRNGTIMLLDPRQIPVMWWNFSNALPVRWTGPTFDARSGEVGFEAVELVHEGLTKPLLSQAAALGYEAARLAAQ